MDDLAALVEQMAQETSFSGAVRVDKGGAVVLSAAYGFANRAERIATTVDTRFAIASGVKGFTALVVASLIDAGVVALDTPVRSLLGEDLPLVDDGVTIEHLLAHRSGIGDYCDEYIEPEPEPDALPPYAVQALGTTEDYVAVLDGYAQKFPPGERFEYCNGGFVLLALVAERAAGTSFFGLVADRVCRPAGMTATEFLRSDALPGGVALGYLDTDGLRTNVFHLPVRGSGDGGIYTTLDDMHRFWPALFAGDIVPAAWVERMLRPVSELPDSDRGYGLGFWVHPRSATIQLEGADVGVSFRSLHDPGADITHTVISNTPDGAWPMSRLLLGQFGQL